MKKLFGIIGNPINHSLSPILHNYWFEKYKINANYSIIDVEEKNLGDVVARIKDKSLD
jgi:shikimate dehydrogenase